MLFCSIYLVTEYSVMFEYLVLYRIVVAVVTNSGDPNKE